MNTRKITISIASAQKRLHLDIDDMALQAKVDIILRTAEAMFYIDNFTKGLIK